MSAAPTPDHRHVAVNALRNIWEQPAVAEPPRRTRSDWFVLAFTLLLGLGETLSSGLGWTVLRAGVAVAVAGVLLQRRRAPLVVLVVTAGITLAIGTALRIAEHYVLVTGLMFAVAVYALVRWASGRHIVIGLGVVAGHAVGGYFVDPNWDVTSALLFYGAPVLLACAMRPRVDLRDVSDSGCTPITRRAHVAPGRTVHVDSSDRRRDGGDRVAGSNAWGVHHGPARRLRHPHPITGDAGGVAGRGRHAAQRCRSFARNTRLRWRHRPHGRLSVSAAGRPRELHVLRGGRRHRHRRNGFLQHDPKDPVGMPLLEFLEYAAIAEFPIVKLDLKRDRVGSIIDEVQQAIDRFGLDPSRVHFNADVFRGPGVDNDIFGARKDLSFTDSMYNRVVMELETSDLIHIAGAFPESTIVVSANTPTGPLEQGYSENHLERFVRAADEIREVNPVQALVFAVRGDLAAQSGPHLLQGLTSIEDSYVAAWWSADVPPTPGEIETLRAGGVAFFDLGQEAVD